MPRTLIRTALLLLIALAVGSSWSRASRTAEGMDIYQWWLIPRVTDAAADGNLYSVPSRKAMWSAGYEQLPKGPSRQSAAHLVRRTVDTFSTPFFYACFRPLSLLSYEQAFHAHLALLLACGTLGTLALCRMTGYSWEGALLMTLTVATLCGAFRVDLWVGNVTSLQLAGLAIYLGLRRHPMRWVSGVAAGALLGLGVAFKPSIAPAAFCLVAWWLTRGEKRTAVDHALGAAIGGALAVAVSLTLLPLHAWSDWLACLPSLRVILHENNLSLYRLLESLGAPMAARLLPYAAMAGALALTWRFRKTQDPRAELLAASLGLAAVLVGATLVWVQYLLLAVPLAVWALAPVCWRASRAWTLAALAGFALALHLPLRTLFPGMPLGALIGLIDLGIVAMAVAGAWNAGTAGKPGAVSEPRPSSPLPPSPPAGAH